MPRTPIIAGNWKMNTQRSEAIALARAVRGRCDAVTGVKTIVCPPYVFLHDVHDALAGSSVGVGAQDLYWEEKGAFTGEISVTQVAEAAEYVIIGHSERRQHFGETDATVNQRVASAIAHGLKPIMCVGETLDERNAGKMSEVLVRQTRGGIEGISIDREFIIAYEPVWAIGTGLAADGAMAEEAIALIRTTVGELAPSIAGDIRILYGGSVTPDNIAEYLAQPDIDGGLVGGASLKAETFAGIVEGAAAAITYRS